MLKGPSELDERVPIKVQAMRGIRGKRVKTVKEGTLIVTIDVGMTTNTAIAPPPMAEI